MRGAWLLAVVLLAGCSVATPVAVPSKPDLATLAQCNLGYPDGSALACKQQATDLGAASASAPLGYLCIDQGPGGPAHDVALYRSLDGTRLGFAYNEPAAQGGVRAVMILDGKELYVGSGTGSTGFWSLPSPGDSGNAWILLYRTEFTSATPALHGAAVEQWFSVYDQRPYAMHHIKGSGGDFYDEFNVALDGKYSMSSYSRSGSDYSFSLNYTRVLGPAEFDYSLATVLNQPQCNVPALAI